MRRIKLRFMLIVLWCLEAIMIKVGTGIETGREIKMDMLQHDIEDKLKEE